MESWRYGGFTGQHRKLFLSAAVKQEVGTPDTKSPCVPIIHCAALAYKDLIVEQMPEVARENGLTKFVKHSGLLMSRNDGKQHADAPG